MKNPASGHRESLASLEDGRETYPWVWGTRQDEGFGLPEEGVYVLAGGRERRLRVTERGYRILF